MVRHERVGATIFLLILLIIVTPKVPTITGNATLMGVSVNDSVLMLLVIIVFAVVALTFYRRRPDVSTSNKSFKRFYKPKSDVVRLSQYAQERTQAGDSSRKVRAKLLKAGWAEETIQDATAYSKTEVAQTKIIAAKKKRAIAKVAIKKALKEKKLEAIKKRRTR
jgi:hypothetical protein